MAPRHSHPGEEIVYVLEGSLDNQLDGKPPVTLKPGEVLFIPAGGIHAVKNVGKDKGAELATCVVLKREAARGDGQVSAESPGPTLGRARLVYISYAKGK